MNAKIEFDWVTDRLAVGTGIWTHRNMWRLADAGVTHVVNLQEEFDDSPLAEGFWISILRVPMADDLQEKSPEAIKPAVEFCLRVLQQANSRVYVHCAAGIHRSPMIVLAILGATGMKLTEALELIRRTHPVAEFPAVYLRSVARFVAEFRGTDVEGELEASATESDET